MSENSDNCIKSDEECIEYYLLVDYNHPHFYRVTVHDFDNMFEIFENLEGIKMCKFNENTKKNNKRLDSYICSCWFNHAKSNWRVDNKEQYKIKGTYYWYNNIYSS